MAGSYTPTGTYSNLTRLELEQLRQSDYTTHRKALTIGDAATGVEKVVGRGSLTAEPYTTGPSVRLDDIYALSAPAQPGPGLLSTTSPGGLSSETVRWYGPDVIFDSFATGFATAAGTWEDNDLPSTFLALGVQVGDVLLVKPTSTATVDQNANVAATITAVAATTLTVDAIWNPTTTTSSLSFGANDKYSYLIIRPTAVQLFAVPGSGPLGREQTFLFVQPGSPIHNQKAPSAAAVAAARITDLVPPGNDPAMDRADFVYPINPNGRSELRQSLETLGYRVVLYPGLVGGGADLTKPIAGLTPIIDATLPLDDQRMTIDYKAGIVRFSCAPLALGDINPNGALNATTGRLQLFAVFWAYDTTLTRGNARGLWAQRSDEANIRPPGRVYFNTTPPETATFATHPQGWRMGTSTTPDNNAYVKATGSELPLSTPTSYPFLNPWERKSTEFGTIDTDTDLAYRGLRYFSYRPTLGWTFQGEAASDFRYLFGYGESEREVADKTARTFSDVSSPAQGFADVNPTTTYGGSAYGARNHNFILQNRLAYELLASSYGVAHFRKGVYYVQEAIAVPPGSTIEGEGPNTRFVFRNFDGTEGPARLKGLFKVGPNTTWGVYDATARPSALSPYRTQLSLSTMVQPTPGEFVEGMDLVWNPVRRTWAMVYADVTSGTVMFNEFRTDGNRLFPGNGINVKDNANALFSQASVNGEHHSGGHYPRLAFHQHTGEYIVVWVEEYDDAGFIGPRVRLRYLKPVVDAASPNGWVMSYPYGASIQAASSHTFSDHPSIAIEDWSVFNNYLAVLTFWSYSDTVAGQINGSSVNRRYYQNGTEILFAQTVLQSREICSSTDVKADEVGGFLTVFSVRVHRFLRGTNGTITPVAGPESYITDPGFNFSNENVVEGSKFFLLSSTVDPLFNGIACVVYDTAGGGGTQARIKDERGTALGADGPGIIWAMTPPVRIQGVRTRLTMGSPVEGPLVSILAHNSPSAYQIEMREPDYVRLSRGGASWCVAFQGYNSVGWPAFGLASNYDFGFHSSPTSAGIVVADFNVYREHVSTCAVILQDNGRAVYPTTELLNTGTTGALADPTASQFFSRSMRDNEVSLKSLGTRPPLTERPNYQSLAGGLRAPLNATREVSFVNFSYRWTETGAYRGVQACIPGITWTGQDWVIVSPAKPSIHSFTGYYQPDGFGNAYLSDVMFYFGEDAPGTANNGWPLRRTLPTVGAQIYLPGATTQVAILAVVDEHTVQISGVPLGAVPVTQVEWMLVTPDFPNAAGIKNQGFRINPEGRILTSTSFTTWADEPEPTDKAYWKREIELMRRPTLRGGNYPSQVAGGVTESNDALEPGSRIKGNINFRGVAPGRPKGTNRYAANLSPKIALAWGDNLYGMVDHVLEGGFTPINQIEFYRQSFGPYNVTLRNFAIEASPTEALKILSRAHVYTRHYAPTASNVAFDTDGFRNVFVYPGSRVVTWYDATFGIAPVSSFIGAVYTDALGQNPIRMQGPLLARGDLDIWCSDVSEDVVLADSNNVTRTLGQGTGPKVFWDGQRFAVVWIERANRPVVGSGGLQGGFHGQGYQLSLSFLPGSEDAGLQSSDLLYPLDLDLPLLPLASTTIEDGTGWSLSDGTAVFNLSFNTVAVCDVAFSGKVYAVVWAAGTVPNYTTTYTKGSALGVTIFGLDSAVPATTDVFLGTTQVGGGRSYLLEQTSEPGSFHNPKILWDGAQFVVFFEITTPANTATPPNLQTSLAFAYVPEDGLARPSEVKMLASPSVGTGTPYTTGYPGTGAPYSTTPNTAGILGFALAEQNLGPMISPYYGANHTVLLLWGNQIEIGSNTTLGLGLTTGGGTTFSGAGDFLTRGVRPGDILVITSGNTGADNGYYTIQSVAASTLQIDNSLDLTLPPVFVGDSNIHYTILRLQQPNVQAGDTLVVTKTVRFPNLTFVESAGVFPVIHYDPRTHRATVLGKFANDDISWKGVNVASGGTLYGEIRGGTLSNYDMAPILGSARSNTSSRSYFVGNPQWATGSALKDILRLWGAAYNDLDDEFGLLYTHADDYTYFTRFKASTRSTEPEVLVAGSTLAAISFGGDIAWNGAYYLVAGTVFTPGPNLFRIRASLLNSRGVIEAEVDLESNTVDSTQPDFLFGNGAEQLPGPGYGSFPTYATKVSGTLYPLVQQVKVKWNDRLSRWVVAASVLWYDSEPQLSNPNVYPENGVTSSGGVIASWMGRTITFTSADTIWQPGVKLAVYDAGGGNLIAVVTIIALVGPGPTYTSILVDATSSQIAVPQVVCRPVIREDVLCWTLGQDARGLILEDADNVFVENVVIHGAATNMEESWPNMARPVWQAGGQTFGQPSNVNFGDFASLTKPPGYNHRFMTPEGKVNLPKYTNVSTVGRHPYGHKRAPGSRLYRSGLRGKGGL